MSVHKVKAHKTAAHPRASASGRLGSRITASGQHKAVFYAVLIAVPAIVAVLCICVGRYSSTFGETLTALWRMVTGQGESDKLVKVIFEMRLPRVVLAMLVGGGLSAAGLAFQSLFANPLATPDTLGVASGASFGAVAALLFGLSLPFVQISALIAGFIAVALTLAVGKGSRGSRSLTSMILGGMVISSLFSALISLAKLVADTDSKLPAITYWLMGSLSSATWNSLTFGVPFILAGIIILFAIRWRLNILPLSEDEVKASGSNVGTLRFITALAGTMITAACVSLCGQVGWVGLLVPHICRMALGSDNLVLVPASISVGAVFMMLMDTAARSMTASEIPISVLTAIVGAPFFIALLRKTGGWSL